MNPFSGNVEEGAIHIANAIALCGPSQQLLQIFQQTLPPEQYAAVIEQLPHTRAVSCCYFFNKGIFYFRRRRNKENVGDSHTLRLYSIRRATLHNENHQYRLGLAV